MRDRVAYSGRLRSTGLHVPALEKEVTNMVQDAFDTTACTSRATAAAGHLTPGERQVYAADTTARMGSCRCGDCVVRVYPDGTVQYVGNADWQRSQRHSPTFPQPRRPYDSQISAEIYLRLLKEVWDKITADRVQAAEEDRRDALWLRGRALGD
jgi:hypothetical protein